MDNQNLIELENLLGRLKADSIPLESEEATKQGVILPILNKLGWDRDNVREVMPEYRIDNGRVDYCLRWNSKSTVFVEAKRADQDLDKHQEQLLDYAFREGVELAVLSNGLTWWLYLPLVQGSWEQRKFFTIDILQQDSRSIAENLLIYLGKHSVIEGSSVKHAKAVHEGKAKEKLTGKTIPKAWKQMLSEPDELLEELLSEKVENLCGHKPSAEQIANYLLKFSFQDEIPIPVRKSVEKTTLSSGHSRQKSLSNASPLHTFKKPTSYKFLNETRNINSWRDLLLSLCSVIYNLHPDDFRRIKQLRGKKREWFSEEYRGLRQPIQIQGTTWFVESNLSANDIGKRCYQIIRLFGYRDDDLQIEQRL